MNKKGILFSLAAILCCAASWAYGALPEPGTLGMVAAIGAACHLDIVTVAPLQGWRQSSGAIGYALMEHRFTAAPDGQLEHYTDGTLRATVPPEGWAGYLEQWPEAASLVQSLTRPALTPPPESAPAVVDPGIEGQEGIGNGPQDAPQGGGIVASSDQGIAGG